MRNKSKDENKNYDLESFNKSGKNSKIEDRNLNHFEENKSTTRNKEYDNKNLENSLDLKSIKNESYNSNKNKSLKNSKIEENRENISEKNNSKSKLKEDKGEKSKIINTEEKSIYFYLKFILKLKILIILKRMRL